MNAIATAATNTTTATTTTTTTTANTSPAEADATAIGAGASLAGRAWSQVAASLETLATGPRRRRERGVAPAAGDDATDPIHHLTMKLTGAIDAAKAIDATEATAAIEAMAGTGPAGRAGARHPAVGLRIGQVAAALEQALRETAQAIPPLGRHAARAGVTATDDSGPTGDDDRSVVLFAGPHSRLVVTTVPPGQATGAERHEADRVVLLLDGAGECVVDGRTRVFAGADAQCVLAGTDHAIRNTGDHTMRIATVFAPPVNAAA